MTDDASFTGKQFQEAGGTQDWRVLAAGASAWFNAPSHTAGAELARRVVELTADRGLVADVDLRNRGLLVRVGAPYSPHLTTADLDAVRAISGAARDLGLVPDPTGLHTVQLTIDAVDRSSVIPFWRTALGYELVGDADLVDPLRRDASIWFQQQGDPRPLRNRLHVDVARLPSLGRQVVETVEAIGGRPRQVSDYYATLADADGNEVDIVPLGPHDDLGDVPETADWRALFGGMTFYPTASPVQAAELASIVAATADEVGLPILVDLRPNGVTIDTGKDQWEDERFATLAGRIQTAARGMGLTADPARLRFVQIGIDAVDVPAVREFWRVVLGYSNDPREGVRDIFDPRWLNMPIIFQQMPASEEDRRAQRNRIHVDVYLPDDQAQARIDAAIAAGGRIVYDDEAPEWWTIADPEGNEVDIAVTVGREEIWLATQGGAT